MTQVDLIKKYKLAIRGRLGQHILIDPNVSRKIVQALDLKPSDLVLEIGPGLGSLTEEILGYGCQLVAVEKDPRFVEVLKQELKPRFGEKLELHCADFLEFDLLRLCGSRGTGWKIISNLPYYMTAPILFRLFDHHTLFSSAVLMLQREVARRMNGSPGTKEYGRLTLGCQYFTRVSPVMDVRPSCFTPKPQVDSSVVVLMFLPAAEKKGGVAEKKLFDLIRVAFSQRRKTMLPLLAQSKEFGRPRRELEKILAGLGLALNVRGEALSLDQFIALCSAL